jgi:hypothetical protein
VSPWTTILSGNAALDTASDCVPPFVRPMSKIVTLTHPKLRELSILIQRRELSRCSWQPGLTPPSKIIYDDVTKVM